MGGIFILIISNLFFKYFIGRDSLRYVGFEFGILNFLGELEILIKILNVSYILIKKKRKEFLINFREFFR